jgi:lipid-A-disaccharide synthase
MTKKAMISAGEPSGEMYGALLSREIRKKWPDVETFGIGGVRMKEAGVNLIAPISNIIGITEAVKHLFEIRQHLRSAKEAMTNKKPDILILIDYPDFNLALAKRAKSLGIPVLYYVSPQVWAWRRWRIKKISSLVNKIALILPFEADYYRDAGLSYEFVGHPLAETISIDKSKEELKRMLGLDPQRPVISLLPGSRRTEIERHMPVIKDIAAKIRKEMPEFQIVIPLAPGTEIHMKIDSYIKVIKNRTKDVVACSAASAVASGTATLEAALIGTPMVVFYRVSAITYLFAKLLVKVKHYSLVNLLAGKEVVLELIQNEATADKIFSEMKRILNDTAYRYNMIAEFNKINDMIGQRDASVRTASIAGEIAGWNSTSAS